ncbi:Leucine rich repeat N-terminal domain [Seminavis robusta]|uniref:Leucine rich repeat N-terminal domain n=1 Tax=Seminavis robusta TaxID=568900 RepID=A0A9N8EDV7_9STRA|nr:Leucine rich repeat N-terminal domain [Seminavis robusta]|eukprot:Sro852_g211030.1 Leucine rich repeat N-terminal domain (2261) ;mRNA; r:25660-32916
MVSATPVSGRPRQPILLAVFLAVVMPSAALDERRILVEFFEATSGAQWLKKDNWGSDQPICSWHGVSCLDGSQTGDSEVDTIQLPENNIAGAIPSSLYSMPLLRFLDLEGNPITNAGFGGFQEAKQGTGISVSPLETLALNNCNLRDIAGVGGAPTSLRDLRLAGNSLQGDFPTELFQVTSLRRLFLDQNAITGAIPSTIGNMDRLIDFHAIGVPFTGKIPSEFGLLTKLVTMVLRDNDFTGTIPTELNNMLDLEILSIGRSTEAGQGKLSGPLPSFSQLPYLELLDFSLNKLNGTIPRDFFLGNQRTDDLVIVRLDGNELTGTLPKQLGWIDSMDLGLTGNLLVGPIPQELCEKKQWMTGLVEQFACDAILCPAGTFNEDGKHTLTADCEPCATAGESSLYLGQTTCGGSASADDQPWMILAQFYLALGGSSWTNKAGWSSIDAFLLNSRLSDLKSSDLDICSFFGVTCTQSGDVQKIDLSDNRLFGAVPAAVFSLAAMTEFDVSSNRVSVDQEGFAAIVTTGVLTKLALSHTEVNSLAGLEGAVSLQHLYLDGVKFEATLPNALFSLTNLQTLEFPNSNLRGPIPTRIGSLQSLVRIELRWNDLTGQLPSEFGLLTNLEELDLSYNNFEGNFPTEMILLPKLRELELGRSERGGLGGPLPTLAGLTSLEVLGFAYNNFEGSMPDLFLSGVGDKSKSMKVGLGFNRLTGVVPHQLDVFSNMVLELEGNGITDLPSVFCDNTLWMEGYVGSATFGCNAILCPPGTWNTNGKETNGSLCEACSDNDVYGATHCGDTIAPTTTTGEGSVNSTHSGTPKTEAAILDMLFAATNGKDWTAPHDGWTAGSNVCNRQGVSCDDDGNVDALRLNRFGMSGQIPTEIFQLQKNRVLGFTDNNVDLLFDGIEQSLALETLLMSNTKIKSLQGLQRASPTLKSIHVARNQLGGSLPDSILGLQGLRKLFFNENMFTGPLPAGIGAMTTLKELHLWDNLFTGHIPSEIGLLTNLQDLDLRSNRLSGPIPAEFAQLTQIVQVDLSSQGGSDKLSGPLYAFPSNSLLQYLNVSKNAFAGTIPSSMLSSVDKTKEIVLDVSNNELSGGVPSQFSIFEKLDLYAAGNKINALPEALCNIGGWMSGDLATIGTCDAILCPPGTYSSTGRANTTANCAPCASGESATYYGSLSCSNAAQDTERDILTGFYNDLNGAKWTSNFNWGTESGVCTWFGITCNDALSVVEIKLASNQIVSTKEDIKSIAKIFELPNLQVIDLKGNSVYLDFTQIQFSSSLQSMRVSGTGLTSLAGLSRATKLRRLHATDNLLNGTLPAEMFDLTNLRSLYLSFNSIEGTIPRLFSSLTDLQEVYLYGNKLEKSVPTELGLLGNLRELVLARNYLTGTIPTELSSLSHLEQLSLYDQQGDTRINGQLPTFENSPNVWFFDVSNCDLTGTIPGNFMANSVHVNASVTLIMKNNKISGTIPSSLKRFDSLDIDLTGNQIEGISNDLCHKNGWMKGEVGIIGSCDAIVCPQGYYNEHGRQKSAESPCTSCKDLSKSPYLGQTQCRSFEGERGALNLLYSATGGKHWTSSDKWSTDAPVCSWEGIECGDGSPEDDTGVTAIKLEKKNLAGSLPTALWSLPSIRSILLSGNEDLSITFDGLSNAASTLQVLQVSNTKMDSLEGIEQATSLKDLFVDENGLTGAFPHEIFDLHNSLEKFRLSANYFYGSLPTEITKMTKLMEFHAADNEFYATIPSELALLTKLQSVALNENLFYGDLPTELSNMPQLQIFSVRRERKAGPRLSGKIPPFNNCPSLTVLFLDGNDFSGEIPSTFLSSSSSVYLVDLKNNSISGGVPEALDNLGELDIRLEGNQITTLPQAFCDNTDWMGGNVGRLKSCDAIMCGPGTANPNGRALSSPDECKACSSQKAAPFYGSRSCEPVLTEREILVKLYESCNGAEWKIAKNWNSNTDVCEWHGIGCKDGHVILINLGANNLKGSPPHELFDLPRLEILWLNSNPIRFSFEHIGRATNLMDLRVDETSMTSLDGVGAAVYLTSLHVGFNAIGGPFPAELLQLKNIRTLSMNNNVLTGPIPDMTDLAFLRTLRLGHNKFRGAVPSFEGMHILNTIDISGNELSGSMPDSFLERVGPRLKLDLDLSNNKITGTVPRSLSRFENLSLYLRGNMIGEIPNGLCNKANWNNGDVGKFGCDGLLCAPGTSSFDGRYSSRSSGCEACPEAKYYGQVACVGVGAPVTAASSATASRLCFTFGLLMTVMGVVAL